MSAGHRAESDALRDVVAERERQIAKGYTPEHDDEHTTSQILRYGGLTWYPACQSSADAARTRTQMVRMAACLLAAIEQLDRRVTSPGSGEDAP